MRRLLHKRWGLFIVCWNGLCLLTALIIAALLGVDLSRGWDLRTALPVMALYALIFLPTMWWATRTPPETPE